MVGRVGGMGTTLGLGADSAPGISPRPQFWETEREVSLLNGGLIMGLFSRKEPGDPRYVLPSASNRDYYKYQHISRNEYPMMNLAYFEKSLQQGIPPNAVAERIDESRSWAPDMDIAAAAQELTGAVFRNSPDIPFTQSAADAYLADIHFGVLAGIFERRSGQYKKGLRHPAVWNALSMYIRGLDEDERGLTDEQKTLRIATPHLGYTQGIEPAAVPASLLSRWNA